MGIFPLLCFSPSLSHTNTRISLLTLVLGHVRNFGRGVVKGGEREGENTKNRSLQKREKHSNSWENEERTHARKSDARQITDRGEREIGNDGREKDPHTQNADSVREREREAERDSEHKWDSFVRLLSLAKPETHLLATGVVCFSRSPHMHTLCSTHTRTHTHLSLSNKHPAPYAHCHTHVFLSLCVLRTHTNAHMFLSLRAPTHTHTHKCVSLYLCLLHTHTHPQTMAHTSVDTHTLTSCMHTQTTKNTFTHIRTQTHAQTHTRTHACMHTHTHTHTHTRARTHTHAHTRTHAHTHTIGGVSARIFNDTSLSQWDGLDC